MKHNPFPGMNPWLESRWHTVHSRLITYACDQLQQRLPEGLFAITEEGLTVDAPESPKLVVPDVQVAESWDRAAAPAVAIQDIPVAKSVIVRVDPEVDRWIEIIDQAGKLVTVVELLSPSNKESGLSGARRKRKSYAEGQANYVEIDLLRGGRRVSVPPDVAFGMGTAYFAVIIRSLVIHEREIIGIPLEQPLPALPIPLRKEDADVPLELQPLVDTTFANARFPWIDYRKDPDPPLNPQQNVWADKLLREAGLR